MNVAECTSREEYLAKLEELQAAGRKIGPVYDYWYEGAGNRKVVMSAGPAAKAMWQTLTPEQRIRVAVAWMAPDKAPPDIAPLCREYRECLLKDYELLGGHSVVEGKPEDAVWVIEYE